MCEGLYRSCINNLNISLQNRHGNWEKEQWSVWTCPWLIISQCSHGFCHLHWMRTELNGQINMLLTSLQPSFLFHWLIIQWWNHEGYIRLTLQNQAKRDSCSSPKNSNMGWKEKHGLLAWEGHEHLLLRDEEESERFDKVCKKTFTSTPRWLLHLSDFHTLILIKYDFHSTFHLLWRTQI